MLAECGASRATTSLPRGRFFLIVAGRFPAVKNNLNLIRTANKAGGCYISPMRIARTPEVERGNELAHAAHDLPRPSAEKWCSEMVIFGPFCNRFTKSPRRRTWTPLPCWAWAPRAARKPNERRLLTFCAVAFCLRKFRPDLLACIRHNHYQTRSCLPPQRGYHTSTSVVPQLLLPPQTSPSVPR